MGIKDILHLCNQIKKSGFNIEIRQYNYHFTITIEDKNGIYRFYKQEYSIENVIKTLKDFYNSIN